MSQGDEEFWRKYEPVFESLAVTPEVRARKDEFREVCRVAAEVVGGTRLVDDLHHAVNRFNHGAQAQVKLEVGAEQDVPEGLSTGVH